MADISFADVKVHNEVEFCTITDLNVKKQLERLFLDERISYYEKWDDVSFFKRVFAGGENQNARSASMKCSGIRRKKFWKHIPI